MSPFPGPRPIGRRSGPAPPGPSGRADPMSRAGWHPMTTHVTASTGATGDTVSDLLERSHRLGADPKNTNYAGGNTSAKGSAIDPLTGRPVELLWVKGSGGDLGTLTEAGLAVLRLDRLRSLVDVYPGVEQEDEMVAAFDHCLFGRGGAAPSIDTAMHGLVDAAHVDHLHPDSGIAFATAADGEALTRRAFGDRVAWTPWRRPGFQLGLDIAAIRRERPDAIGVILGGHGITAWGATSEEAERNSLEIIRTAERFIAEHGRPEPLGAAVPGHAALPEADRRARAAALFPLLRGLASTDRPQVGHYTDSDVVLDFVAREAMPRLAALGTSCPDHFLRTKVRPLVVDLPGSAPLEELEVADPRAPRGLPRRVRRLLRTARHARLAADARCRPGDRARSGCRHVQLRDGQADRPGRRRVLRQRDQRHARCGGNQHVRADPRIGEVPHRVLGAGGGQAGPPAQAEAAGDPRRIRDRRRLGDRTGDRPPAGGRRRVRHRRRHRCGQRGGGRPRDRHHRPGGQRRLRRHR